MLESHRFYVIWEWPFHHAIFFQCSLLLCIFSILPIYRNSYIFFYSFT